MKKIIITLTAVIFLAAVIPVFAENIVSENTNTYAINFTVEKIFPSNQGYIVQYRTQRGFHTVGIPNAWFFEAAGRGDKVILPRGPNWPSMSVFYNDGEFSHVRLYVHAHKTHQTWGNIPMGTDVSSFFAEDTLDIQF